MKTRARPGPFALLAALLSFWVSAAAAAAERAPISLHPDNPHYLLFRDKPTVLVGSTEHYGAVMNLDFDYEKYLNELETNGQNVTRTFSGAYMESPQSFNIQNNTMAPGPGRLITPWARSQAPGYANGGNKFDLSKWDDAYFARLKSFMQAASKHGVVVEYVFFCPFYEDAMWNLSPQNAANNVNGTGQIRREQAYMLQNGNLLAVQEALVRKVVSELKDFDNLYYEICNEPYFGGVTLEWQHHIADVIVEAEKDFPHKHLIAQNIANKEATISKPHSAVSIFNFHYATPPTAVATNYALDKVIADDETGFAGIEDVHYRTEAWDFMLAGGAIYNNLDYSFTVDAEDGTFDLPPKQPGGGGRTLRQQLGILRRFIESFHFTAMRPEPLIPAGSLPEGMTARCLADSGKAYAVYIRGGTGAKLTFSLPPGRYEATWIDVKTGDAAAKSAVQSREGAMVSLTSPAYTQDIALDIRRDE